MSKAKEVFEQLFNIAIFWVGRQSPTQIRNGEVKTKPGDMLNKLSPEEREELKNLKSDDLADVGKIPREHILFSADSEFYSWRGYTRILKEAKEMFDSKILKHSPGSDRKKY